MIPTFPDTVFSKPNSFPAVTIAISSSHPGFKVCIVCSSSNDAYPNISTHFLANFSGNSEATVTGLLSVFIVRTTKPSC